ncbi:MAG: hypothetical protein KF762_07080 [Acidobacteria bacterium]|nr:hypothetical protein [Acidobacteriota bacterium]
MLNSLKISLVLIPIVFLLVVGVYAYSLWASERKRAAELPVEAADVMMRDLLSFHKKRGGFPKDLKELEGVVWEKKENRNYSNDKRGLTHRNYYYLYTHLNHHRFTLWAIPVGRQREDAATQFLLVTTESCRRWKGAALSIEQASEIAPNPSVTKLSLLGLIEQAKLNFREYEKTVDPFRRNQLSIF